MGHKRRLTYRHKTSGHSQTADVAAATALFGSGPEAAVETSVAVRHVRQQQALIFKHIVSCAGIPCDGSRRLVALTTAGMRDGRVDFSDHRVDAHYRSRLLVRDEAVLGRRKVVGFLWRRGSDFCGVLHVVETRPPRSGWPRLFGHLSFRSTCYRMDLLRLSRSGRGPILSAD
jgi:hypothetical protein